MSEAMAVKKAEWIKVARGIYWVNTLLLVSTMLAAGVMYLAGAAPVVEGVTQLGYPAYVLKILGLAKLLAGLAILQVWFPTLKEWAYAGYTFNLLGAAASHAFCGDPVIKTVVPLIILGLLLISYRQWKTGWM